MGDDYDKNPLPDGVTPLPVLFRQNGYYTFNEGGKDDYNFEYDLAEFYDHVPKKRGWGPAALVAGDCWAGRKDGQPFLRALDYIKLGVPMALVVITVLQSVLFGISIGLGW